MRGHRNRHGRRRHARNPPDPKDAGAFIETVKRNGPRDFILLLFLCFMGAVLGRLQTNARNNGKLDFFGSLVQATVNPPARAMTSVFAGTSEVFADILSARSLKAENRRLTSELRAYDAYAGTVDRLRQEVDSLRKLQNFPAIEGKVKLPAEVIGFFPYENRLTLSVGAAQGIQVGQPVVAPEGLIGRVQIVGPKTCQALLLSSPENTNRIGAIALRNPPSAGLLRGESATTYVLEFSDAKAPVSIGDLVVTSGFSEHIPRGIPIGRVIAVEDNVEFGKRQARVYPSVAIGAVREVFVLK